ncbi:MAG: hypothetical protein ACK418_16485 [Pseudomonas sp.]|uniref:hypothetical protein n=1 Tax=Pseudomonas sp. TaxID=306 RepID=UPI00391BE656
MDGFGMLSLGASAGLVTGFIVSKTRFPAGLGIVLACLLPIFMAGVAVFSVPELAKSTSTKLFPIGLLASLMWLTAGPLLMEISSQPTSRKIFIFAYAASALSLTIAALKTAYCE